MFPAAQTYHVQAQITELVTPGQTPDLTRNAVATGYVVVPEFSSSITTIFLLAGLLGAVAVIRRSKLGRVGVRF